MVESAERSPFIVSPAADWLLVLGSPLLIVAVLLPLAGVVPPEAIWAVVMTFGSVGHHLPGFLRTYGDAALFRRFRARFVLAPPLVFGAALFFASRNLHAVLLLALLWSIWHGMMQHYGFLRVYDLKAGAATKLGARFDFSLTVAWFALCLLWSPNQLGSVLDSLYQSGFPLLRPVVLQALSRIIVPVTVSVSVLYAGHLGWQRRQGRPVSALKLVLLVSTTGLVFFARVVTRDPFLTVALFEVLHDAQYLAIVWAFNRRLVDTGAQRSRLAALFTPRPLALVTYVGACLLYGGFGFATDHWLPTGTLKELMVALLVTSGILHYYYDGFIWKVRDTATLAGLMLDGARPRAAASPKATGWRDLGHALAFAVAMALFGGIEALAGERDALPIAQALVESVPENPTAQQNLGMMLFERGRASEATTHFDQALRLQPRLPGVAALLGDLELRQGNLESAVRAYQHAVVIGGESPEVHNNLGYAYLMQRNFEAAAVQIGEALRLRPDYAGAHLNLGLLFDAGGHTEQAAEQFRIAIAQSPGLVSAYNNLGGALLRLGQRDEAAKYFRQALELEPSFAPALHNLQRLEASESAAAGAFKAP